MKLQLRIVLALLAISAILVAPAVYGVGALRELSEIARSLRTRDAVGALALGRLQAALGEVENRQRIFLAVAEGLPAPEREAARAQVEQRADAVTVQLRRLAGAGYTGEISPALERWRELRRAIAEEQRLIEIGAIDQADAWREEAVDPGFTAVDRALDPIGAAINRGSAEQVQRALDVASQAATTTLLALAVALTLVLLIGSWLTHSLLRPIQELRRGMAVVAEGDFEPEIRIAPNRPDELGDLGRSFHAMSAQLAELDRLKAEFVSIASHELKTPLSVIRGYVSLLQDGIYGEISDTQQRTLASISDQTDRLTRLVQQLLDVSRFEAGGGRLELRPIDLQSFLGELVTSFEVLAFQSRIDFSTEMAPGLPRTLTGDPDRLNEVLGNLLSNAFKFTPRGGRIRLRAWDEGREVMIEVADSGVGIPPDKLPMIFEKFFQVENEAQPRSVGSGLGLAIAREIVEAHGGTIGAESTVGQGTTFRVRLPKHPASALAS